MLNHEQHAAHQRKANAPAKVIPPRKFVAMDSERVVLGAIFADPEHFTAVAEMQPEEWGEPVHGAIFEAMQNLVRRGYSINHLSVAEYLKDHGALVLVGGPAQLMGLDETIKKICNGAYLPTPKAVAEQVARVRDMAARRAAIESMTRTIDAMHDMNMTAEELLLRASGDMAALAGAGLSSIRTATEYMEEEVARIEAIQAGGDENVQYIPTGLELWDELLGGLPRGVVTVIGGQASVGKSTAIASMVLSIAEGSATQRPEKVAVFSLEDRGGWLPRRWLAEATGFAIRQLLKKGLTPEAVEDLKARKKELAPITDRILIDDRRRLTAHKVAAKMRQLHARHGVRVFFIDHLLEMLDKSSKAQQARDLAVGEILEVLRDVAIELDVVVVLACHLRDPETPGVDSRFIRPRLQDFAGGQFINRMARLAVGLWLLPQPPEPKPPKEEAEPKFAAKSSPEQRAAGRAKWEQARAKANADYSAKYSKWREQCEEAERSLVFTSIKATEGSAHFDFGMYRVQHAGLLRRKGGWRDMNDLGFTRPPPRR